VPVDVAIVGKLAQTVFPGGGDPIQILCFPVPGYGRALYTISFLVQPVIAPLGSDPISQLGVFSLFLGTLQCPWILR
jgi:hypothetical protein